MLPFKHSTDWCERRVTAGLEELLCQWQAVQYPQEQHCLLWKPALMLIHPHKACILSAYSYTYVCRHSLMHAHVKSRDTFMLAHLHPWCRNKKYCTCMYAADPPLCARTLPLMPKSTHTHSHAHMLPFWGEATAESHSAYSHFTAVRLTAFHATDSLNTLFSL